MVVKWVSDLDAVELVTPSAPNRRAGIISVQPPHARGVSERLREANVRHSFREGAIRLSPYAYNTEAEIQRAIEVIESGM